MKIKYGTEIGTSKICGEWQQHIKMNKSCMYIVCDIKVSFCSILTVVNVPLIIYDHLLFIFSFHCLLILSWSNCLTIPFLFHFPYRYFQQQQLQDLSMLQRNLLSFNTDWKMHPLGHHHPQWCPISCRPMVPLTWWKKIDPRRWGSLLLPVWLPCMGTAGQERYWMGQRRHQLWQLTFLKWTNLISIFKELQ